MDIYYEKGTVEKLLIKLKIKKLVYNCYVGCLWAFCTVNYFEFNSGAFLQRFKAVHVES